jgi:hypothetical protein
LEDVEKDRRVATIKTWRQRARDRKGKPLKGSKGSPRTVVLKTMIMMMVVVVAVNNITDIIRVLAEVFKCSSQMQEYTIHWLHVS